MNPPSKSEARSARAGPDKRALCNSGTRRSRKNCGRNRAARSRAWKAVAASARGPESAPADRRPAGSDRRYLASVVLLEKAPALPHLAIGAHHKCFHVLPERIREIAAAETPYFSATPRAHFGVARMSRTCCSVRCVLPCRSPTVCVPCSVRRLQFSWCDAHRKCLQFIQSLSPHVCSASLPLGRAPLTISQR